MPYDDLERTSIFNKLINQNKKIYFAVEDISIIFKEDIAKVDDIWKIKKTLKYSLKSFKNING